MVISLSQHANAGIRACRGRDMAAGAMEFAETRRIEESIKNSINFLVFEYMTESEDLYRQLVLYGTTTRRMTVYMVALITLLSVVVTMDIKMPGIDGMEAIRVIKERSPATEIIIISAYDEFDVARDAMQMGISHYILKPISREEFIPAIENVIRKKKQQKKKRESEFNGL